MWADERAFRIEYSWSPKVLIKLLYLSEPVVEFPLRTARTFCFKIGSDDRHLSK